MPGPEEDLAVRPQAHGLVGGEEGAGGEVGAGALAFARMATGEEGRVAAGGGGGLVGHCSAAEGAGEPSGGLEVGRGGDLHEASIGEEGTGALAVGGAELVQVLQDGPELDAEACHEAYGALDGVEAAEGGELVEQEEHGRA